MRENKKKTGDVSQHGVIHAGENLWVPLACPQGKNCCRGEHFPVRKKQGGKYFKVPLLPHDALLLDHTILCFVYFKNNNFKLNPDLGVGEWW